MVTELLPPEDTAQSISQSVVSIETTNARTLNFLRAILGVDCKEARQSATKSDKPARQRTTTRNAVTASLSALPKRRRQLHAPQSTILECPDKPTRKLTQLEQRRVATDTFNATLKTLGHAAKSTFEKQGALQKTEDASATMQHVSAPRTQSSIRGEFENPLEQATKTHKRSSHSDKGDIEIAADCAILSLDFLRALNVQDEEKDAELPQLRLEKGAIMLLDRLITLDLASRASRTAACIKLSLEGSSRCLHDGAARGSTSESGKLDSFLIAHLLRVAIDPHDQQQFDIVTSLQSQIMRLAFLGKQNSISHALLQVLQLNDVEGPAGQLARGVQAGLVAPAKAGQRLRALSQAIMNLCASSAVATEWTQYVELLLSLRCVALEIRVRAIHLSPSNDHMSQDILSHFGRALRRYQNQSHTITPAAYDVVRGRLDRLRSMLGTEALSPLPLSVKEVLAELAEGAGQHSEAVQLLEPIVLESEGTAKSVIYHCKLAALKLIQWKRDPSIALTTVQQAILVLESSVKPLAVDTTDLLVSGARFRKATMNIVRSIEMDALTANSAEIVADLRTSSIRAIFSFHALLLRQVLTIYSGLTEGLNEIVKTIDRSIHLVLLKNSHCILELARLDHAGTHSFWNDVDRSLQGVLTVARILEKQESCTVGQASNVAHILDLFSRVSHIYWHWYTELSGTRAPFVEPLSLLIRSIEAMSNRSSEEQLQADIPKKCERCAALYVQQGVPDKARTYYLFAISLLLKAGVLIAAAEIALSDPWHRVWSPARTDLWLLGQCLSSGVRIMRSGCIAEEDAGLFFDDSTLPPMHKAVVLQIQMFEAFRHELDLEYSSTIVTVSNELRTIYDGPKFAALRLQFGCELLACTSKKNETLALQVLEILGCTALKGTAPEEDCFLAVYAAAMRIRFGIQSYLAFGGSGIDSLRVVVEDYEKNLASAKTGSSAEVGIDNPEALCRSLRSLADFAHMHDVQPLQFNTLRILNKVLATTPLDKAAETAINYGQNAMAFSDIGEDEEATQSLVLARSVLKESSISESPYLLELARASHFLHARNYQAGVTALKAAGKAYQGSEKKSNKQSTHSSLKSDVFLGRAILIASQLAFHSGALQTAIAEAKRVVKLTSIVWKNVEKHAFISFELDHNELQEHSIQSITNDILTLDLNKGILPKSLPIDVRFWNATTLHIESLLQICMLSAHCGMHPDALYYVQQAQKIASKTIHSRLRLKCDLVHALLQSRSGEALAFPTTETFISEIAQLNPSQDQIALYLLVVQLCLAGGQPSKAQDLIRTARNVLAKLRSTSLSTMVSFLPPSDFESPATNDSTRIAQSATGSLSCQMRPTSPKRNTKSPKSRCDALLDCLDLLEGQILLTLGEQADVFLAHTQLDTSVSLVETVDNALLLGSFGLRAALGAFADDPIHCILEETATSLPSCDQSLLKTNAPKPVSALSKGTSNIKRANKRYQQVNEESVASNGHLKYAQETLRKAYWKLYSDTGVGMHLSAAATLHRRQKLLTKIMMLASASGMDLAYTATDVVSQAHSSKNHMRRRERWAMAAEDVAVTRSQVYSWPLADHVVEAASMRSQAVNDLLSALPPTWFVVSLSLSIDRTELTISRLVSRFEPFTLRIPLSRSASDELDQCHLSHHDAATEMADIIAKANTTAHDARSYGDRHLRKDWWKERQALDKRLEELLSRMEMLWLGGFRGILSSGKIDNNMLEQFAASLNQSLNKHLPSRKTSQVLHQSTLRLHKQIIELFVALGHPDEQNLDNCLMDLLYFAVDVLQLNGERNPYDEIDFDMLFIEVLDALKIYHAGCVKVNDGSDGHVLLVLDKDLHSFPWESMPCMEHCSTSRVPTLSDLKERLDRVTQQNQAPDCFVVSKTSGSYILNPSSDLSCTQETFKFPLQHQLPSFTSIVDRIPKEAEFSSCLQKHDIFLFFGHGSGAQYIRGRTIKKLDNCAVALLMGCSSAKVIECGDYEPYGVPWNYMFAGAPAVVGTLWDVTDKDIDRFAAKALTNWGLVDIRPEQQDVRDGRSRTKAWRKAHRKRSSRDDKEGKMTLDEAVADARQACTLRYLNGAAPVMYGIPVAVK